MSTLTALRDRAVEKAARRAFARTMAMPIERPRHTCFAVTVRAVTDLTPLMRRLTLHAPELVGFTPLGPDEYFGLVMPPAGAALPPLPADGGANPRPAFSGLAHEQRPAVRWYTIRAHRPALGEVDVDVVVHPGDPAAGPGADWVLGARTGDRAGFQTGTACYRLDGAPGAHVLVADETGVPAASAILEQLPDGVTAHLFVEVPRLDDVPPLPDVTGAFVQVIERGDDVPGSAVLPALAAADLPPVVFGWTVGEQGMVKEARRHLVSERGIDKRAVYFCGYWIQGRERL